jgi:predicted nucleic acid-binding protein
MNNIFIDSNICVYAFDRTDARKQQKAFDLIGQSPLITSQVIIETFNACNKKLKLPQTVCEENTLFLCDLTNIWPINSDTIKTAVFLKKKYLFSFLDACIVSAAYCSGCSILYSEDLQHNLIVEGSLTVINPFI